MPQYQPNARSARLDDEDAPRAEFGYEQELVRAIGRGGSFPAPDNALPTPATAYGSGAESPA